MLQPDDSYQLRANSASTLAADLALTYSGTNVGQLTLPTPAFVPTDFLEDRVDERLDARVKTAQEFVRSIPEYRQIFGSSVTDGRRDEESHLAKMKIMITSVGGPLSAVAGGWIGTLGPIISDEEHEQLENTTCGDLCGHFLPKYAQGDHEMIAAEDHEMISRVNARVFGPSPRDFQTCNALAKGDRLSGDMPLGVILVASTGEKAEAVLAALNRNCVSTLIVDQELAEKIVELEPDIEDIDLNK